MTVTNHGFTMEPENDDPAPKRIKIKTRKPKLYKRIIRHCTDWFKTTRAYKLYLRVAAYLDRSITVRILKNRYAPITISMIGAVAMFASIFIFYRSEAWWLRQMVVSVNPIGAHVARAAELSEDQIAKMTDVEYIKYKFGNRAGEVLRIYKAESGGDAWAINQNTDKGRTLDLGCMQLNEKWQLKPRGLTRADAFNCKKSIGVSFQIFSEQGNLCAWTSYRAMEPKKCK